MTSSSFTASDRRHLLVKRHLLDRSGVSVNQVAERLVAIHATDPATPFLSTLARTHGTSLADVTVAMYEERSLVRWMAMRRTVFAFNREDVSDVQAAVSGPLADVLRRRLITLLTKNGALPGERNMGAWVADVEQGVLRALATVPAASGAELSAMEPRLRTPIPVRLPSDTRQTVTSFLLAMMSASGEIVRAVPVGSWTTRQHRWQLTEAWWPDGLDRPDPAAAASRLARRWLLSYGPATVEDLQWWTGWSKTTTRAALVPLPIVAVDLDGVEGIDLTPEARLDEIDVRPEGTPAPPVASLLPALDSTAMGWKHRQWYGPEDTKGFYDVAGNIGPTIWWQGAIVGMWASTQTGVRTHLVVDGGVDLAEAVGAAAARLESQLRGVVVTPAIRTALEKSLAS